MSRQLAKLSALYSDLSDRYGPNDPIVVELKEQVERGDLAATELPFGERRKENQPPHLWGHRLGQGHARLGSRPTNYGEPAH